MRALAAIDAETIPPKNLRESLWALLYHSRARRVLAQNPDIGRKSRVGVEMVDTPKVDENPNSGEALERLTVCQSPLAPNTTR